MKNIPLSAKAFAVVDDEDYPILSIHKWQVQKEKTTSYAVRSKQLNGVTKKIYMHREIIGTPPGMETDHIDGDGLNNQRANLRVVTKRQNRMNRGNRKRHGYVGVSKQGCKYRARLKYDYKDFNIGIFDSEVDAAKARDKFAREIFGEYARLNFPEEATK